MVDYFTPWNRNEAPTRRFEPTDTDFFEKMELTKDVRKERLGVGRYKDVTADPWGRYSTPIL